jgi:pyruvate/2-oxoglutarate dehydrogenase complex dihydrolipoamide dehydrogenase (E3) component
MSARTDYDVIVLGGGSAGTSAAAAAGAAGARVAMVNDGELGGLCILRGCMPTKTMLHSSHLLHEMKHAEPAGVFARETGFDFGRIMERKNQKVKRFQAAKIRAVESSDYEVLEGRGSFVDHETVAVGDRTFRANGYVIATGSAPSVPPIPGIQDVPYLTSDDVMRLAEPPESIVVQGAGPIGLELGQFLARLGVKVLLVNRSKVLSKIDRDCSEEMTRVFEDEPDFDLVAPGKVTRVSGNGAGLLFEISAERGPFRHRAGALLLATGRDPAVSGLGLERAGVETDGARVRHDAGMRTTNPRIYVAGDATGLYQVLHLANQEGRVAGHNAAGAHPAKTIDYRLKMAAIFTDPPFATVGMTEEEARAAGLDCVTAVKRFPQQGRAITMEVKHGLVKVIARCGSGEILGSQILGPRADDLIHVLSAIMYYRGSARDICGMPWYHPTLAEALIEIGRDLAARFEACEPPVTPPA